MQFAGSFENVEMATFLTERPKLSEHYSDLKFIDKGKYVVHQVGSMRTHWKSLESDHRPRRRLLYHNTQLKKTHRWIKLRRDLVDKTFQTNGGPVWMSLSPMYGYRCLDSD